MKTKIDQLVTSSRPDIQVTSRKPGAYIITKTGIEPDLNDHAMAQRAGNSEKAIGNSVKEETTESKIENKTSDQANAQCLFTTA